MDSPRIDSAKRKPVRTTIPLPTRISPAALQKARADAESNGYTSLRSYLEALVQQGLLPDEYGADGRLGQFESVAPSVIPTLIGHRTVRALEALGDRIDAGVDTKILEAELREIRREVAATLLELHTAYDREMDVRDERVLGGQFDN